jgi:hypothetical protein
MERELLEREKRGKHFGKREAKHTGSDFPFIFFKKK